jgi:hypothetical protein
VLAREARRKFWVLTLKEPQNVLSSVMVREARRNFRVLTLKEPQNVLV